MTKHEPKFIVSDFFHQEVTNPEDRVRNSLVPGQSSCDEVYSSGKEQCKFLKSFQGIIVKQSEFLHFFFPFSNIGVNFLNSFQAFVFQMESTIVLLISLEHFEASLRFLLDYEPFEADYSLEDDP